LVNVFEQFLEGSWTFIFIISIIFIFILIYRDLGKYTRRLRSWHRASSSKSLPKIVLTFQHFTRRGDLISLNNLNLYTNLRQEMIAYLQFKKGLSDEEVKALLADKEELLELFHDEKVVAFLHSFTAWQALVIPKISLAEKLLTFIKNLFFQQQKESETFYLELAFVIRAFRKALQQQQS